MIPLQNELNSIGKNFNQVVKELHTLNQISEFKNWLIIYKEDRQKLMLKVDEIKTKSNQIFEQ